jgi:hypothetical protein
MNRKIILPLVNTWKGTDEIEKAYIYLSVYLEEAGKLQKIQQFLRVLLYQFLRQFRRWQSLVTASCIWTYLESGHWLTVEMMRLLAEEYDPSELVFHGSPAISSLMHSFCAECMVQANPTSNTCKNIHLLETC